MKLFLTLAITILMLGCSEKKPEDTLASEILLALKNNDIEFYRTTFVEEQEYLSFKDKLGEELTEKVVASFHIEKDKAIQFSREILEKEGFDSFKWSTALKEFNKTKENFYKLKGFNEAQVSKVEMKPKELTLSDILRMQLKEGTANPILLSAGDLKKIHVEFDIGERTYKFKVYALATPKGLKSLGDFSWSGLVVDRKFEEILKQNLTVQSKLVDIGCKSMGERWFYDAQKRMGYDTGECELIEIAKSKIVKITELGDYSTQAQLSPVEIVKISYGNKGNETWIKADKLFSVTDIQKYL